ncbi:uncharacterized protein [Nicotiana sylvestris]|uniref:uncharacterized protein n=1 Tax=Nicotiana sylvestris TaxID=4096 RepID=UPI00388CDB69
MAGTSSYTDRPVKALMPENDASVLEEGVEVEEDEGVPTAAEILPHPRKLWNDFNSPTGEESEPASSTMDEAAIASYMLEIESARRADTWAKIFLMMLEKYHRYHNKCREMHRRLRASADNQSLGEELDKRDQELMQSIHRNSELEELLHVKDEELELGKGVSAECEHLQAKVLSLQSELDQNIVRVEALSVEWMEKLAELERKVFELESAESARASASVRAATLEDTICILQSEQESESAMATLREARLEERIGEIDRETSNLGDRVAVLEAEKAQLLAQVESASAAVPRHLYKL